MEKDESLWVLSLLGMLAIAFLISMYFYTQESMRKEVQAAAVFSSSNIHLCREIKLTSNGKVCSTKNVVVFNCSCSLTINNPDADVIVDKNSISNLRFSYIKRAQNFTFRKGDVKDYLIGEEAFPETEEIIRKLNKALKKGEIKVSVKTKRYKNNYDVIVSISVPKPYVDKLFRYYSISKVPVIAVLYSVAGRECETNFLLQK